MSTTKEINTDTTENKDNFTKPSLMGDKQMKKQCLKKRLQFIR